MFTALANAKRRTEKETGAERCPEYIIISGIVFFAVVVVVFLFILFLFFFFRSLLTVPEVYAKDSVSC